MERLVSESLAEGGIDNITVIVADVVADDGTDAPVILGAAGERDIPVGNGTGRLAAVDDDLDEDDPPAAGPSGGDDESRYTPLAPGRRRLIRPLVGLLVLLLVVGAGLGAAYAWTRTQFYVGVAGEQVAIYQGLADSVPGVPLSRVYEIQPLAVSALPPYYADRVRGNIEVPDLASARAAVAELTARAERCAAEPTPTPTPTPTPRPTAAPSAPTATASAVVSTSPAPTPQPTQPEC
jgi:protein phosphatase